MLIECHRCTVRGPACQDCVVTFLLGPHTHEGDATDSGRAESGASVELTAEEIAAVGVLADQGVVPPLRLRLLPGGGNPHYSGKSDESEGSAAASH